MPTSAGVSPGTTLAEVLISLIGFTVIYGVLAIVEVKLLLTYIQRGLPDVPADTPNDDDIDAPLAFAY